MAKVFRLPDLGEGIHEGEIVEVLVRAGDPVTEGQPLLIVETDKAPWKSRHRSREWCRPCTCKPARWFEWGTPW